MTGTNILHIDPDRRVGLKVRHLSVSLKSQIPKQQPLEDELESSTNSESHKILNDINFDLAAGQLMAIMGGSGSGKTTLLNTLSQRTNITNKKLRFSGSVNYITGDHKSISHSYLLQTDYFLPGLTILETLKSQADLRLPSTVTQIEKNNLIEFILNVLELSHLKNSIISSFSSQATSLSGGEQRRVSLAIQLLSKPAILFLDEPTTGLDTSSSLKLVELLHKLTNNYGITIILSIHQPRPEICELFDKICLLTRGGRLIYYGNLTNAETYFNNLEFINTTTPDSHHKKTIMDQIMDLSVKDTTSKQAELLTISRINKLVQNWKSNHPTTEADFNPDDGSIFHHNLKLFARDRRNHISFLKEIQILTSRTFLLSYRDYQSLLVLNLGSIVVSITAGWMFFRPKHDLAGIRSLISTLYVTLEMVGFCPMYFEVERLHNIDGKVFYSEYSENWVSIPGFIISRRLGKFLVEDLPISIIFSVVTYFMWGLDGFGIYFIIVMIVELCCMGSSMLCFSLAPDFAISSLIINIFYQLQNSACGYFVNAETMPVYVKWTKYIAYFWYGFGALTSNQFTNWKGDCPFDSDDIRCQEYTGEYQLAILGFPTGWIGEPIGILIGWMIGFFVLSGLAFYFRSHDVGMAKTRKNKIGGDEDEHEQHEHQTQITEETTAFTEKEDTPNKKLDFEISINDINLSVKQGTLFNKSKPFKPLLCGINATFKANKVNVIMGPSGSGKTTLLNYLSNRLSKSSKYQSSGNIYLNDNELLTRQQLNKLSAYVTQTDNSLIENLTVRETLYYQARLRLPESDHPNIPNIINQLIRRTGLVDCAETPIGSEYLKGISGGEKRRVSIAIQLLSRPKILFLDEPTSGLDSSTAETILSLLDELARDNQTTVILTIHQPSEAMFYKFGSLLLLSRGGKVVYNGSSKGIIKYLGGLGYHTPKDGNVADYILDLISKSGDESSFDFESRIDKLVNNWIVRNQSQLHNKNEEFKTSVSDCYIRNVINIEEYYHKRLHFFITFPTIVKRQIITSYRAKDVVISRAGQTIFLTIIHTLFFTPLRNTQAGISNRLGLIQEVLNLYFAGLVNNISLYPFERNLFYQEYKDGIYGVVEFAGSYLLNELPTEIIPSFFFSALIVFVCGLPRTPQMFFAMFSTAVVSLNCGESLGILVSSVFNHMGVVTNVLAMFVMFAIFMGGTMSLHMPQFFWAMNFINPMKYAVAICANLGFEDQMFECSEGLDECVFQTGEDVLEYYNLSADIYSMIGGLVACLVLYRFIAVSSIYVRVKWFN
ncbi:uncharacterized protein J8A68_001865 [[Candida] subhashii]|uniref:ABC transporter domain-containing protein n=1 Tax=[Candida] subhashii TaxID=561895 RepID=A0A8J5UYY0_9ASCO|nr:uncharacterized protein J8A68_001865 [[Candida] subhashii]KAG7664640.1 hypothetical protein J8A68_001865 [[Candida] subhashii]